MILGLGNDYCENGENIKPSDFTIPFMPLEDMTPDLWLYRPL